MGAAAQDMIAACCMQRCWGEMRLLGGRDVPRVGVPAPAKRRKLGREMLCVRAEEVSQQREVLFAFRHAPDASTHTHTHPHEHTLAPTYTHTHDHKEPRIQEV